MNEKHLKDKNNMTKNIKDLIIREKKLSAALRCLYGFTTVSFLAAIIILFSMKSLNHDIFVLVFLSGVIAFLLILYIIIVSLLKTHREIAKNYQQIFKLENVPSFEACKEYFKNTGFLVYEDNNLIIANKLLLQNHKGLIKRDYLIQIVATSHEIILNNYVEEHQAAVGEYFEEFQNTLAGTKNKIVTVGACIHYVKAIPQELAQEFKVQAQQRYILKLDIIVDENEKKLYYPSHIESYKDRSWCGQLIPAPYNEIESFIHKVFL